MFHSVDGADLNIFVKPARIIIAGASGSGKSFFVSNLLQKYSFKFSRITVIGSNLENCENLNITRNDNYNPLTDDELTSNSLIIYDDIIYNKSVMAQAAEVFLRGRHKGISAILITQNAFLNNDNYRIVSLNTTHMVLFRCRDLRQIQLTGKTFLPDSQIKSFLDLYRRIVVNSKYNYILCDFSKFSDSPLMLRTNIVGDNGYERAFLLQ